jgi:7-cyano-7-deazaguanine reductase
MENLKALGQAAKQPNSPEEAELERVPNPHPDCNFVARFTQPEFTSLCPVTAQPDFAHLVIDYVPRSMDGRIKIAKTISWQLSQPSSFS